MAIQDLKIAVLIGNVPHQKMTSDLSPLFQAFAVGDNTNSVSFTQAVAGVLTLGGKLQITGGTADDHAVVKSQLDGVNTALGTEITALQGRCTTLEGEMTALQGQMTTLSSLVTTYDGRITTLETNVAAIYANTPKEARFTANGATALYTVPGFSFDASNSVQDIEVWIDGRRQEQSIVGDFSDGAWRKHSTTQIETAEIILVGKSVIVWKQGTSSGSGGGGGTGVAVKEGGVTVEANAVSIDFEGGGVSVTRPSPGQVQVTVPGGGGGSTDLTVITTEVSPLTAGAHNLGTATKPWASVYLQDTNAVDIWRLQVINGTFTVTKVN